MRTWYRRDTGWFGQALRSLHARIRIAEFEAAVGIDEVGMADPSLREQVDDAYRGKYGRSGTVTVDRMTNDDAAATTLRLNLESAPANSGQ